MKLQGVGRLVNAASTDTPAKLLKLELGCQLPVKSHYKVKMKCFFLLLNLKEQQKSRRSPFTVS